MVTVYEVSSPDLLPTRLHLPCTAWGHTVRERLAYQGYAVQALAQAAWPDSRDAAELARRDALLEWAAPD